MDHGAGQMDLLSRHGAGQLDLWTLTARDHSLIAPVKSALGDRFKGKETLPKEPRSNSKHHRNQPEHQKIDRQHRITNYQ